MAGELKKAMKTFFAWHVGVSYLNQNTKRAKREMDKASEEREKELDRLLGDVIKSRRDYNEYMSKIKHEATMDDFMHRWFIEKGIYLWLIDYYRCPDERVLVRSVTDEGFSIAKEIKTNGSGQFKLEGRVFTVPYEIVPRMFNPYKEVYDDRQKTRQGNKR